MPKACCGNQKFERHADPAVADIGSGGGAELTIGRCSNCGAILIQCWVAGAVAEGIEVVSQALVNSFLSENDPKSRKKLIGDWFNSVA